VFCASEGTELLSLLPSPHAVFACPVFGFDLLSCICCASAQVLPAMDAVMLGLMRLAGEYADIPMLFPTVLR
jgi:hypothetical protein